MSLEIVKTLLKKREKIRIEFKEARNAVPQNLFETVCAFLNREGGSILLGLDNEGNVTGVDPSVSDQMCSDISSLSNNQNKLSPPFLLFPSEVEIKGNKIIHLQVPASSQVHKSNGIIFDRSSDGDFRVTSPEGIAEIFNRKRAHYTEGKIYPLIRQTDFKEGLLDKIRYLIKDNKSNHPWLGLSDDEFFRTSGLFRRDYQNGTEGFTLASVLLFGKDEVIKDILPHYKIDALLKKSDVDRYDDRVIIESNLIEAYNQLMDFVAKHLPDKFFLDGDARISLRERIFREVIANLIVHREYTNAHSATFTIYKNRVEILNANNPNGSGPISISNFLPFPKNPIISKFFVQIGRVEELGSGIINVNKYLKHYSPGSKPEFIEDNLFRTIIPIGKRIIVEGVTERDEAGIVLVGSISNAMEEAINEGINEGIIEGVSEGVKEKLVKITAEIKHFEGIKGKTISDRANIPYRTLKNDISLLTRLKIIVRKGSKKTGGYYLTDNFKGKLAH
jgi:ATP-dependent DNA helicase RecG